MYETEYNQKNLLRKGHVASNTCNKIQSREKQTKQQSHWVLKANWLYKYIFPKHQGYKSFK